MVQLAEYILAQLIHNGLLLSVSKVIYAHTLVESYEKILQLSHPKVVSVLGLCPTSGFIYLLMLYSTNAEGL